MLTIFRSNRAEWLAKLLSEQLRNTPPEISEVVEIVVNTWPTSRWLGEEIAIANGINAQIKFPFPGTYFKSLVAKTLQLEMESNDHWEENRLAWSIIEKLPEFLEQKEAIDIQAWIKSQSSVDGELSLSEWLLAKSIANVIDDYILYRPDLINHWYESPSNSIDHSKDLPSHAKWQSTLFKLLKEEINTAPFSIQVKRAIEILREGRVDTKLLPKQIRIFGITSLPPLQLELIQSLSGIIDIEIYLLTPCKDLWQRCRERRERLEDRWRTPFEGTWLLNAPRLETALGRMGAEFQQLLEGSGEYQLGESKEEDLFALPIQIAKNQSRKPTLLEQLQEELISTNKKNCLHRTKTDDSLIFVECPGLSREVQVVRDQILQWLAKDKTLEPRDILIMTPQIEKISPFISSAFNDIAVTKVEIPWRITDRSQLDKPGLIQYILLLLDLSAARFTFSSIDLLLSNSAIQQQHNIDQDDVNEITNYLQLTGFRWGLDGSEREDEDVNSLRWCLDRWIMGLILPTTQGIQHEGIAPFSKGLTPQKVKKWWNLLTMISNHIKRIRSSNTCIEWISLIKQILDETFGDSSNWSWERKCLLLELENWRKTAGKCKLKISNLIVNDVLNDALAIESGRFGHRSGSLTISALEPMRAIPHRVVVLMGLDEDIYPRQLNRIGFNLLEHKRVLGDPSRRDQDRYVLLEAIISARQHLMITWNSRNERTGEHLASSTPIRLWIEYLKDQLDEQGFSGLITKPSANPLDPNNFVRTKARPAISCDGRHLDARKWLDKSNEIKPMGLAMPIEWENKPHKKVEALDPEKVKQWIKSPQLTWLNEYQLNPKEFNINTDDIDCINLTNRQRFDLLKERLDKFISNEYEDSYLADLNSPESFWEKLTEGQGIMPPKSASKIESDLLEERWQSLQAILAKTGECNKRLLNLGHGEKEYIWAGEYLLTIEIGKSKAKAILEGWLNHLQLSTAGIPSQGTIVIARTSNEEFRIIAKWSPIQKESAKEILVNIQSMACQGLKECWPVPPESGWALAKAMKEKPSSANKVFEKKWIGEFRMRGERDQIEMKLCFGSNSEPCIFLENESFKLAFALLYEPIINNLIC